MVSSFFAPSVFGFMNKVFRDYLAKFGIVYIDDILFFLLSWNTVSMFGPLATVVFLKAQQYSFHILPCNF